jgi:magnesium transporter
MIRGEIVTGLIVGVLLAAAFLGVGLLAWGDTEVVVSAALALVVACAVATLVAMALPTLFRRLGVDPAFGSGPLATVIQDLLSVLIYFTIAAAIVG